MDDSRESYLVTAAVTVGSLVLIGALTYGILVVTITALADLAGAGDVFAGTVGDLVRAGVVIVALATALEVARVQLHGVSELRRGPPIRRLGRNLLLAAVVLAAFVTVVSALLSATHWGLENDSTVMLGLVALNALALAWVLARSVEVLLDGYFRTV